MGRPTGGTPKPENRSGPRPGNLFGPALPPRLASSSTKQPIRPSAPRPAVQNTPSPPPATGKGSHRFNPFARPNPKPDNSSGTRSGNNPFSSAGPPPPPTFNRPSVPSTPPRSVLPPTTGPGDLWESARNLSLAPSTPPRPVQPSPAVAAPGPVAPLTSIPRHLGGSVRAPQPVQQALVQQPPTSVPRNLWEFRTRPVQQQSPVQQPPQPSGSSSTSPPRGREVAAPGPSTPAPTPAPARAVVGDPASDLGPHGFSLYRVVRVRSPSPGTASRFPTHTFDWVCCFCHRNNNEAQHPKQCTNPTCLHVRVIDTREGADQGRRTTRGLIDGRNTGTAGVEVCPDCSYIAYTWVDGRRQPVPIQNPLGMPPRR
ncbi:hypothetical protein B0H65DRAFT_462512 [Neurospora tetraspora]|uniref:Uncharacterized protein n=1 Tax=Neurospora tetraspora TaxID=94610 RepID=A0AAE0JIM0_9PEZI|nr:hypothetical protein B0H65DRAFT_462512 [Neurospora tetraspora]